MDKAFSGISLMWWWVRGLEIQSTVKLSKHFTVGNEIKGIINIILAEKSNQEIRNDIAGKYK